MAEEVPSPVFAVYFPDNIPESPRQVFNSLKDAKTFAMSPEGKSNNARFKRFNTPTNALNFLSGNGGAGDCVSPLARSEPIRSHTETKSTPVSEPSVPYPSVDHPKMNKFKQSIEKNNIEEFNKFISENPRYIVNTTTDMATIVQEGCRYNGLHIAARHGRHEIAEQLLKYISDVTFLCECYGTDLRDVTFRQRNILESYLNTPDKGCCDTPLHIASKFGHLGMVKLLASHDLQDKTSRNKEGATPSEVICSRYHGEDAAKIKVEMDLLLNSCYVSLFRSLDNNSRAKVITSTKYPQLVMLQSTASASITSPLQPGFVLAAVAGPFRGKQDADDFYQKWMSTGREIKLSDVDKGYERVGRDLVESDGHVKWAEAWFFLGNEMVDFMDSKCLEILNDYIGRIRKGYRATVDPVRARLNFDDDDSDTESVEIPGKVKSHELRGSGDADEFEDARESFLDDSLASLNDLFSDLKLQSPMQRISDELDDEAFSTPPSTPPPVYILDQPTKVDNDLFIALNRIPRERLNEFCHIRHFMDKMSRLELRTRIDWPSKDSPRRLRTPRRLF